MGAATLSIPDYRGSDERHGYVLPLPYVIYRGEVLKVDRQGIYSRLFTSDRVRLDLSADAGVPVKSDDNRARTGMPDLDPTFEIGPSLEICISRACAGDRVWSFRVAVRAVGATDFSSIKSAGWVANPHINVDLKNVGPGGRWKFGVAAGPMFADGRLHKYYYGVAPAYATSTRPAYNASGGYSGFRVASAISRQYDNFWVGAFVRYDNLSGAVFEDSPLFRTRHAFLAGIGVAWVFAKSATLVEAQP